MVSKSGETFQRVHSCINIEFQIDTHLMLSI